MRSLVWPALAGLCPSIAVLAVLSVLGSVAGCSDDSSSEDEAGGRPQGGAGQGGRASEVGGVGGGAAGSGTGGRSVGGNAATGGAGASFAGRPSSTGGSSSAGRASAGSDGAGEAGEDAGGAPSPPGPGPDGKSPYVTECRGDSLDCGDPALRCLGIRDTTQVFGYSCSNTCESADECSDADSGAEATVDCVDFVSSKHCLLVCKDEQRGDRECPTGMSCYVFPGSLIGYCLWQ